MALSSEDLLKLLLSILAGGLVGAEREYHDKAAGFRTLIFICAGSALFTIFGGRLDPAGDPSRLASGIISGVGFLGAGVILHEKGRVIGLTTAASIWLTAALGIGIGGGQYAFSMVATGVMLIVLWVFPYLEVLLDRAYDERTYEVTGPADQEQVRRLEARLAGCGLRVDGFSQAKSAGKMTSVWVTRGSPAGHGRFVTELMADKQVKEFRF